MYLTVVLRVEIVVFLQKTFNHLTDICGPLSRGWKPPMAHLAPTHAIMLVLVIQWLASHITVINLINFDCRNI